jgi:hypothetical protein
VRNFWRVLFSPRFERFLAPVVLGYGYILVTMLNGGLALALEIMCSAWLFGISPSPFGNNLTPLLGLFAIPPLWFVVQVNLRVAAEFAVAVVKIAENTSQ